MEERRAGTRIPPWGLGVQKCVRPGCPRVFSLGEQ